MEYTNLGNSGLYVSRICFGAMTFGGQVTLDKEAQRMVDISVDAGINFFDTANIYNNGVSEEMLGKALKGKRDKHIIATKVYFSNEAEPHEALGASRKGILIEVEKSLKRLDTDYIDLYQLHGFDSYTPLEETMLTLDDLVRSGKVRHIGISNFFGWQMTKVQGVADKLGLEKFISTQNYYSLVGRDIEYEILPAAKDLGIGIMVWSPLAGGFLSGKYSKHKDNSGRRASFPMPPVDSRYAFEIIETINMIAQKYNASSAQISTAWLLHQAGITSIISGASKIEQLNENLKSINVKLDNDDLESLNKVSQLAYIYPEWSRMVNSDRGVFDQEVVEKGIKAVIENKRNSVLIQ